MPRIRETRSRSDAVARTAAAAGLLSSWVSPADRRPSDSSRSRWPTAAWLDRIPIVSPSSRCMAIGNQARIRSPISPASITQNRLSVIATRLFRYTASSLAMKACVAPEYTPT